MKRIRLDKKFLDNGWPCPGWEEWILIEETSRKNNFWQKILGNRIKVLLWYGITAPEWKQVEKDIKRFSVAAVLQED